MKHETETTDGCGPPLLIDALRAKKARIAAKAKRAIAKLDRNIQMLADSGAEEIIADAGRALADDED